MDDQYVRAVDVVRVVDGDTFVCDVDLGFYVRVRMSCRLAGINAAEHNQPGGPEAKGALAVLLDGAVVTVQSVRADKFAGRFDAVVYADHGTVHVNVNERLIELGVAVPWDGKGQRPVVPWPPKE